MDTPGLELLPDRLEGRLRRVIGADVLVNWHCVYSRTAVTSNHPTSPQPSEDRRRRRLTKSKADCFTVASVVEVDGHDDDLGDNGEFPSEKR